MHRRRHRRHQPARGRRARACRGARRQDRVRGTRGRSCRSPAPARVCMRGAPAGAGGSAPPRSGSTMPSGTGCSDAVAGRLRGRPRTPDPELLGARGLTATAQTFTHAELVAAIADAAPDGATSAAVCGSGGARRPPSTVVTRVGDCPPRHGRRATRPTRSWLRGAGRSRAPRPAAGWPTIAPRRRTSPACLAFGAHAALGRAAPCRRARRRPRGPDRLHHRRAPGRARRPPSPRRPGRCGRAASR